MYVYRTGGRAGRASSAGGGHRERSMDGVMLLAVGGFLPQTGGAEPGLLGDAMLEQRGTVMRRNKTWPGRR